MKFQDVSELKEWLKTAAAASLIVVSLTSSGAQSFCTITDPLKISHALTVQLDDQSKSWLGDGPYFVEAKPSAQDDEVDNELKYQQYAVAYILRTHVPSYPKRILSNMSLLLGELQGFEYLAHIGPLEKNGTQSGHVLVLIPEDPIEANLLRRKLAAASCYTYLWPDGTGEIRTTNAYIANGIHNSLRQDFVNMNI